ncbi:MAG TPA: lytic murein transglycosylase [Candidatus Paceibacterota bacterium]|nr:lytic murein transglycosylase [Candidatus Paceibacterota bacterium]
MDRPLRPRVLGDISPRGNGAKRFDAFGPLPGRINLDERKVFHVPATKFLKYAIVAAAAVFMMFGSAAAPTTALFTKAAGDTSGATTLATTVASSSDIAAEQAALQDQLNQLNAQIDQYQSQITSYQKQGSTLKGQISSLNAQISKLNLQIQAINLTLTQIDQQMSETQSEIAVTQSDIDSKKTAIGALLQNVYETDQTSLLETFLKNPQLSDFWSDAENIALLQDNLRVAVQQTTDLETQLQGKQQDLAASRTDAASAQEYQQAQAAQISATQQAKNQLLAQTKGQESKYQALLTQTQASAAQIRDRIFQLIGGGQLTFQQAYQYASFASSATGVDPSLILAVLDRESALGQNVGQCTYKTAMSPSNIPLFLALTQQLGLDPNTMLVSCPNSDGAYGGAMGPAQFVPSTWNLYASAVSSITGDNPPSPWKNSDAFTATALYLKDAMTGCQAVYSAQVDIERCTAAKYYAGSHWKNYLWTYGEAVVDRAQGFASDIAEITS